MDTTAPRLSGIEKNALDSGKAYDAKRVSIMKKQVSAIAKLVTNDIEAAVALAKEAAKIEIQEMQTPSGPPVPMKPSSELYAEILIAANRPSEAILAYEESLTWIPERTPSLLGLAKAASLSGEASRAEEMLAKIKGMPGMNLEEPLFNTTETMD